MSNILVVDDEAVSRKVTSKYLSKFGYTVTEAVNGKEASDSVNESTNLIIVDVNLPDISGVDLLSSIRVRFPHIQAIIISGNPANKQIEHLIEVHSALFFQKPFKMAELVDKVHELLS